MDNFNKKYNDIVNDLENVIKRVTDNESNRIHYNKNNIINTVKEWAKSNNLNIYKIGYSISTHTSNIHTLNISLLDINRHTLDYLYDEQNKLQKIINKLKIDNPFKPINIEVDLHQHRRNQKIFNFGEIIFKR